MDVLVQNLQRGDSSIPGVKVICVL